MTTTGFFNPTHRNRANVALAVLLACASACSENGSDLTTTDLDDTAQVTLALANMPPEVACVVIHVAGATTIDRYFPNIASNSTLTLARLPLGVAVFTVDAFTVGCSVLTSAHAPAYVGGPEPRTLVAGLNPGFRIVMRRAAQVSIDVDFGTPGPAPTCAAVGSSCTQDSNCCSSRCTIPVTSEPRIGTCEAPPMMASRTVEVPLVAGSHYLFYPVNGAGDRDQCPTSGGQIYTLTLQTDQRGCLPSPLFDNATAVLLSDVRICEVGAGCRLCNEASCRPSTCFPTVALAPAGNCGTRELEGDAPDTRFLIVTSTVRNHSNAGLPMFLRADDPETLTITPPVGRNSFAVVELGTRLFPGDATGSCGGNGLCGVLEFQQFASLASWSFGNFNLTNLHFAAAF